MNVVRKCFPFTAHSSLPWIILVIVMTKAHVPINEELFTNFIRKYFDPILNPEASDFNVRSEKSRSVASQTKDSDLKDVTEYIVSKVEELRPLLQDNMFEKSNRAQVYEKQNLEESINRSLEGDDDTTIIEFIPKLRANTKNEEDKKLIETKAKDFQDNLQKYKKLRSRIRKALKRETISKKLKDLITYTLDNMIAQMIAHSCTWKDNVRLRGLIENQNQSSADIVNSWNEMWTKLKSEYKSTNSVKNLDAGAHKDLFLKKFQDLVSVMTSDLNTMVNKYKVVCKLKSLDTKKGTNTNYNGANRIENDGIYFRANENVTPRKQLDTGIPSCTDFKLCSEELTDFLLDFFINLNETTATAFNNYGAMFLRDVNDDVYHEKERVVGLINATSKATQKKIVIVFKKQLRKMQLDPKYKEIANIKAVNTFVTNATRRVKKSAHKQIELGLTSVRGKLMMNIQKDVDVNLEADLNKLEKTTKGKICDLFVTCNGRVYSRKADSVINNKNNMFVHVQLNLQDLANGSETTTAESHTRYKQYRVMVTNSPLNYDVTRTTPEFTRNTDKQSKENYIFVEPYAMPQWQPNRQRKDLGSLKVPNITLNITLLRDTKALV